MGYYIQHILVDWCQELFLAPYTDSELLGQVHFTLKSFLFGECFKGIFCKSSRRVAVSMAPRDHQPVLTAEGHVTQWVDELKSMHCSAVVCVSLLISSIIFKVCYCVVQTHGRF